MKKLICPNCNRTQTQGKFCLDCGTKLNEVVTNGVKFKPIDTGRTADQLKRDVRNWLGRIGVQQTDIKINSSGGTSRIEYILEGKTYSFESFMQDNITNNLAAVEQFLHNRVIGIERGIESAEKAFAGYEALPDHSKDSYAILGVKKGDPLPDIKSKYRVLSKQLHPDINKSPQAKESFQKIKEAYEQIEKDIAEGYY